MKTSILTAHNLSKNYTIGETIESVLVDVSFTVQEGEFVVIAGSSGSGKTTLLSLLSGLEKPTTGSIRIADNEITAMTEERLAPLRNELTGFVFQAFHLVPSLNALENVMFPAELRRDKLAKEKAEQLLKRVGVWHRRDNFPQQLSGGEKQRVAICRALINEPKIVFADEPTGNLDSANSGSIIELMTELHRDRGTTLIMATHSQEVAEQADRVIRLHDGRLITEETV